MIKNKNKCEKNPIEEEITSMIDRILDDGNCEDHYIEMADEEFGSTSFLEEQYKRQGERKVHTMKNQKLNQNGLRKDYGMGSININQMGMGDNFNRLEKKSSTIPGRQTNGNSLGCGKFMCYPQENEYSTRVDSNLIYQSNISIGNGTEYYPVPNQDIRYANKSYIQIENKSFNFLKFKI
jgi:hypothetical protein